MSEINSYMKFFCNDFFKESMNVYFLFIIRWLQYQRSIGWIHFGL